MKGIFTLLAILTVLMTPIAAFALELPANYQTKSELDGPYACDKGKTTVKQYINDDEEWGVLEVYTESGDTFINFGTAKGQTFAIKNASETKDVSHKEWDEALLKSAPVVFHTLHGTGRPDCVPAPAKTN
ncbi:MAG: hypothetical protein HYW90_01935 [Candidatus Sungbacteria bacterium]|nr:hypothetical protein [Candidatus Sungbacteria bacterium]